MYIKAHRQLTCTSKASVWAGDSDPGHSRLDDTSKERIGHREGTERAQSQLPGQSRSDHASKALCTTSERRTSPEWPRPHHRETRETTRPPPRHENPWVNEQAWTEDVPRPKQETTSTPPTQSREETRKVASARQEKPSPHHKNTQNPHVVSKLRPHHKHTREPTCRPHVVVKTAVNNNSLTLFQNWEHIPCVAILVVTNVASSNGSCNLFLTSSNGGCNRDYVSCAHPTS